MDSGRGNDPEGKSMDLSMDRRPAHPSWRYSLLAGIVLLGAFLRIADLQAINFVGDEPSDFAILHDLAETPNPFVPLVPESEFEHDQARLPFYLTVFAAAVTGRGGLRLARYMSVLFALVVLVIVFLIGRELFGTPAGLFAAAFQAVSIYDVGFSHFALTASSSLFVAVYLTSLFAFYRAIRTGKLQWLWLCGIAIGVSMGAKLFGVFTLLIVGTWFLTSYRKEPGNQGSGMGSGATGADGAVRTSSFDPVPGGTVSRRFLFVNAVCLSLFAVLAVLRFDPHLELLLFIVTAVGTITAHILLLIRERGSVKDKSPAALMLVLITLAAVYFFICSPFHLDFHRLLRVFEVFPRWHLDPFPRTMIWDFISVLLVRLSIPFNLLWLGALVVGLVQRGRAPYRFLLLAFGIPFILLTLFPFKSTGYLQMVFPVAYLMIAGLVVQGTGALRRAGPAVRVASIGLILVTLGWYVLHMHSLHPYYHIDGYQLGPAFVGPSKPSMVTFEELPAAMQWMNSHLPDGAEVACLLLETTRYNRLAYEYMLWYQTNDQITFRRVDTVTEAICSPFAVLSLYRLREADTLVSEGYVPVQTFWLKRLAYGKVFARPEQVSRLRNLP